MKALTIWQPWASLIIIGAKPYEFRGWRAPRSVIGQRIVVHAAARPMRVKEVDDIVRALEKGCRSAAETCLSAQSAYRLLEPLTWMSRKDFTQALPLAAGLGSSVLGEPRNGLDIAAEFGVSRANDSDRDEHANWGWPMLDIEQWPSPVPMRGAQGFWNWPTPDGAGL